MFHSLHSDARADGPSINEANPSLLHHDSRVLSFQGATCQLLFSGKFARRSALFFAFLSLLPSLIRMMNGQNTAVLCRHSIKSTMPFVYPTKHTTSHHRHLFLISPTDPHPRPWASKTPSRPPHPSRLFNVLRRRSSSHPCHLETPFLATLPSRRSRAHTQFDMSREDRASWCARSRYYGGAVGRGGCGRPCMPWCLCVCYGGGGDARGRGWDGRSDRPWGWEVS